MLPIELREILSYLDAAPVECDGMARLITTELQKRQIDHQVMVGTVTLNGNVIPLHYWVMVGDLTVDYRARIWLGESDLVPHGIFRQDTCAARYQGEPIEMAALSPAVVAIMTMPMPSIEEMMAQTN